MIYSFLSVCGANVFLLSIQCYTLHVFSLILLCRNLFSPTQKFNSKLQFIIILQDQKMWWVKPVLVQFRAMSSQGPEYTELYEPTTDCDLTNRDLVAQTVKLHFFKLP